MGYDVSWVPAIYHGITPTRMQQLLDNDAYLYARAHTPVGVAFPGGPAVGDLFYRTDLGFLCAWNGTYWLTVNEFSISIPQITLTVDGATAFVPFRLDYPPYFTRMVTHTSPQTNDGTRYWNVYWTRVPEGQGGVGDIVATFTTAADSGGYGWTAHELAAAAPYVAARAWLSIACVKTGAAGNLVIAGMAYYRLIVT